MYAVFLILFPAVRSWRARRSFWPARLPAWQCSAASWYQAALSDGCESKVEALWATVHWAFSRWTKLPGGLASVCLPFKSTSASLAGCHKAFVYSGCRSPDVSVLCVCVCFFFHVSKFRAVFLKTGGFCFWFLASTNNYPQFALESVSNGTLLSWRCLGHLLSSPRFAWHQRVQQACASEELHECAVIKQPPSLNGYKYEKMGFIIIRALPEARRRVGRPWNQRSMGWRSVWVESQKAALHPWNEPRTPA